MRTTHTFDNKKTVMDRYQLLEFRKSETKSNLQSSACLRFVLRIKYRGKVIIFGTGSVSPESDYSAAENSNPEGIQAVRMQCSLHSSVCFGCVQSVYSRKHLVWQLASPQLTVTFFFFFVGLVVNTVVCACVCLSGLSWEITASKLAPGSDRTRPLWLSLRILSRHASGQRTHSQWGFTFEWHTGLKQHSHSMRTILSGKNNQTFRCRCFVTPEWNASCTLNTVGWFQY